MIRGILRSPRKLEKADERSTFTSGATELDEWFRRYSWQNQQAHNAVTYVAMLDELVVGYYAIAAAGIGKDEVDAQFARARPSDIPCVLLARLAVDKRAQGRGVGAALLLDAIKRALAVSDGLGAACLLVHCRDDDARRFYLKHADFVPSPLDDLQLVLPLKGLPNTLQS